MDKFVSPLQLHTNPVSPAEQSGVALLKDLDAQWCQTHISCIQVSEFFESGRSGFARSADLINEMEELAFDLSQLADGIYMAVTHPILNPSNPLEWNMSHCSNLGNQLIAFIQCLQSFVSAALQTQAEEAATQTSRQISEDTITQYMLDVFNASTQTYPLPAILEQGHTNAIETDVPEARRTNIHWKYLHLLDLILEISRILASFWQIFKTLLPLEEVDLNTGYISDPISDYD